MLIVAGCGGQQSDSKLDYEQNLELALSYYEKDEFLLAKKSFSNAIKQDSSQGLPYFKRGYCYMQLDMFDSAEYDYLMSINLEYNQQDALYNLTLIRSIDPKDTMSLFYLKKWAVLEIEKINARRDSLKKLLN